MSDHITPEQIEAAKLRDGRIRLIGDDVAIGAELRDSKTVQYLLGCIRVDAERALDDLAELSPTNTDAVAKALVNIRALVYVKARLSDIRLAAKNAEAEIRAEEMGYDERDD